MGIVTVESSTPFPFACVGVEEIKAQQQALLDDGPIDPLDDGGIPDDPGVGEIIPGVTILPHEIECVDPEAIYIPSEDRTISNCADPGGITFDEFWENYGGNTQIEIGGKRMLPYLNPGRSTSPAGSFGPNGGYSGLKPQPEQ